MRCFTIQGMMGLVLGLSVAIAGLRNSNDTWAGGLLLVTPLLIGIAAVGAPYHSGPGRAGQLGFAVFAGAYFALTFLGYSHQNLAKLPTSRLLRYAHDQVRPPDLMVTTSEVGPPGATTTFTVQPVGRWRSLLPRSAKSDDLMIIDHCLFTVLAGLLGASIARWYQAKLERISETGPAG